MIILAFDTATDVATCALVRGTDVLGERKTKAVHLLTDVDKLQREAGTSPDEIEGIVVGTGPGSYTGLRMGLVTARVLAFSFGVPVAGVSTLAALAEGASEAQPVIDARRGEIFTLEDGLPVLLRPEELRLDEGRRCVGDGALRYREILEAHGAVVPADDSEVHVPWARHHASLAESFGPAEDAEPIYLRLPDAERALRQ